jgi:hypothetical protein
MPYNYITRKEHDNEEYQIYSEKNQSGKTWNESDK